MNIYYQKNVRFYEVVHICQIIDQAN